jgi:hypothetical protein
LKTIRVLGCTGGLHERLPLDLAAALVLNEDFSIDVEGPSPHESSGV